MNREMKRMMQRQGQMGPDGEPIAPPRRQVQQRVNARAVATRAPRTRPFEFIREVRSELRKVAWPTRAETINYSTVVLIALAVVMAIIFVLDYSFAKSVLFLFKK